MRRIVFRVLALVAVVSIMVSSVASAISNDNLSEIKPNASQTLASYSSHIAVTSSTLRVHFTVCGTRTMDEIGASKIVLKESTNNSTWTTVKTYYPSTYTSMLKHGTAQCVSAVSYSSFVSGRYYKAVVTVKAERDGASDARSITTAVKKA